MTDVIQNDERRKELINTMFKTKAAGFARCFATLPMCPEPAIRAHSLQNARVLELLADEGHIIAPNVRLDVSRGPLIGFDRVGRNQATTFSGLCAKHDREIFAPIETAPLNVDSTEHRFLLAYRAVYYEVHATAAAVSHVQTGYLKSKELGLAPKDGLSRAGLFAVERMIVAWQTYLYKIQFDQAYVDRKFELLEHDLLDFVVAEPTIAASALFSVDRREPDNEPVHVCLTILPVEQTRTVAILSYLPGDAPVARSELARIFEASGDDRKHELSRRLLNQCQNFTLSPRFVESWSPVKRDAIVGLFTRTILEPDLDYDHPDLTLFK